MDASPHKQRNTLILLSTLKIGGSERKMVRLANALSARGRSVVLAHLNGPDTLRAEAAPNVEVVSLQRRGKFSPRALRNLRALIVERGIDAVVSVNLYATLYAGLLARTSLARRVRFIASINATDLSGRKAGRHMIVYRPVLRALDLLIFGSEHQRALWAARYLRGGPPPTTVLYNGVDAEFFDRRGANPARPPAWPAQRIVIGSVGNLRPEKSQDQLLHALAHLHARGLDVGAALVGEGPSEPKLRELAAMLGVSDRVYFWGAQRDVRPHLAGFDIFALTSATETFSNAALEALAMECPVVSSRVGGMPELLAGGGGATYDHGDPVALADVLENLITDASRRSMLREQARRAVLQRFSFEAMLQSFERLIDADLSDDSRGEAASSSQIPRAAVWRGAGR